MTRAEAMTDILEWKLPEGCTREELTACLADLTEEQFWKWWQDNKPRLLDRPPPPIPPAPPKP